MFRYSCVTFFCIAAAAIASPSFASISNPQLRITEIMFTPAEPNAAEIAAGIVSNDQFEFIRLTNIGPASEDLQSVQFINGIDFQFASGSLAPGESVFLVASQAAFEVRYGGGFWLAGEYSGALSNSGETIELFKGNGFDKTIQSFTYDDSWYPSTDGGGYSLVIRDAHAAVETWSNAAAWAPSELIGGTPAANIAAVPEPVSIAVWSLLMPAAVIATYRKFRSRGSSFAAG